MENTIITKLIEKLEAGSTGIQAFYDVNPKEPTQYPYCFILPSSHTNEFVNLRDTKREYTFRIYTTVNLTDNFEEGQKKLRTVTQAVIDILEDQDNVALDNTIEWMFPTANEYRFLGEPSSGYRSTITLRVRTRFNRFS